MHYNRNVLTRTVDDIYKLHEESYVDYELTFDGTQSFLGKRLQWLDNYRTNTGEVLFMASLFKCKIDVQQFTTNLVIPLTDILNWNFKD